MCDNSNTAYLQDFISNRIKIRQIVRYWYTSQLESMVCDDLCNGFLCLSTRNNSFVKNACTSQVEATVLGAPGSDFHSKWCQIVIALCSIIDPSLTEFTKSAKCIINMQVSDCTAPHSSIFTRLLAPHLHLATVICFTLIRALRFT